MSRHVPYLGSMSTHTTGPRVPVWTLPDRLRKAREETGMDQREFAEHTGISKNTISNYETGKTSRISRPMLAAWAMGSGVPLEWLETGHAPSGPGPEGLDPESTGSVSRLVSRGARAWFPAARGAAA